MGLKSSSSLRHSFVHLLGLPEDIRWEIYYLVLSLPVPVLSEINHKFYICSSGSGLELLFGLAFALFGALQSGS